MVRWGQDWLGKVWQREARYGQARAGYPAKRDEIMKNKTDEAIFDFQMQALQRAVRWLSSI